MTRGAGAGGEGRGGSLEVRVFENRSDLHRDVVSNRKLLTELYRAESRSEEPIRQETVSRWTVSDLVPGRYMLRIRWSGKTATAGAPSSAQEKPFVVRTGQTTVVDVVVKDARKTWIRVAIGTAVVIAATYYLGRQAMQSWDPLGGASFH
ncbi:MAG: hypothetical protein ABR961_02735 [Thermoanaerobaculaceae bacterium]